MLKLSVKMNSKPDCVT